MLFETTSQKMSFKMFQVSNLTHKHRWQLQFVLSHPNIKHPQFMVQTSPQSPWLFSLVSAGTRCSTLSGFCHAWIHFLSHGQNQLLDKCETPTGWWFQPLWKILVSWDDYSQYMETYKIIPNHQPA